MTPNKSLQIHRWWQIPPIKVETITENQNWTQGRDQQIVGSPTPVGNIYIIAPASTTQKNIAEKGAETL